MEEADISAPQPKPISPRRTKPYASLRRWRERSQRNADRSPASSHSSTALGSPHAQGTLDTDTRTDLVLRLLLVVTDIAQSSPPQPRPSFRNGPTINDEDGASGDRVLSPPASSAPSRLYHESPLPSTCHAEDNGSGDALPATSHSTSAALQSPHAQVAREGTLDAPALPSFSERTQTLTSTTTDYHHHQRTTAKTKAAHCRSHAHPTPPSSHLTRSRSHTHRVHTHELKSEEGRVKSKEQRKERRKEETRERSGEETGRMDETSLQSPRRRGGALPNEPPSMCHDVDKGSSNAPLLPRQRQRISLLPNSQLGREGRRRLPPAPSLRAATNELDTTA
ncbi:hypothetical protein R3P38DRAFT_2767070 [Favolaschia claudopus]|uniref:Uncharacterized protein n=1 Tax=Favolaschia claudopus TaxID=2862362 RepID=A0AAW0CWW2_9AGAR